MLQKYHLLSECHTKESLELLLVETLQFERQWNLPKTTQSRHGLIYKPIKFKRVIF